MTDAAERVHIALLGGLTVTVGPVVVADAVWPTRRSAELVALARAGRRAPAGPRPGDRVPVAAPVPRRGSGELAQGGPLRPAGPRFRQGGGGWPGGGWPCSPGRVVDTDIASYERRARAVLRSGDHTAAAALGAEYPADLCPTCRTRVDPGAAGSAARCHVAVLRLGGQWERLVAAEPTDEHAHRELMRAALRAGAPHTAIRWYGRLRTNLEDRLGLPPSAETRALYEECVAVLPATQAVVGRQPELARMAAALRSRGALVLRGAPGIGKSTLCRELAVLARDGGWHVAAVTRGPGPRRLRGAVRPRPPVAQPRPHAARPAARTDPRVLAQLSALAGPRGQGELTRHMVIGAVHRLLAVHRDAPACC